MWFLLVTEILWCVYGHLHHYRLIYLLHNSCKFHLFFLVQTEIVKLGLLSLKFFMLMRKTERIIIDYFSRFNHAIFLWGSSYSKTKLENVQLGRLLKSPIFVVQKASTPKYGVKFCKSLLVSSDVVQLGRMTIYDII